MSQPNAQAEYPPPNRRGFDDAPIFNPPMPDDAQSRAVRDLTAGLVQTIRVAQALVGQDRVLDLSGFPDLVGRLCAMTLDLPPDQGRALRPELQRLCDALESLGALLRPPDPTTR